jgi:hypothetical protein
MRKRLQQKETKETKEDLFFVSFVSFCSKKSVSSMESLVQFICWRLAAPRFLPKSALSSVASAEEEIRPPSPRLRRAGNPQL